MAKTTKNNLGRGLSALLGDDSEDYAKLEKKHGNKNVPIEFLRPGRFQPRHSIDKANIEELAQSIRDKGILQPILVRRHPNDPSAYEIIAGERRWRAAQRASLHEVPVIIKELADRNALEVALVENLQRLDLSPLEEAESYRRLMQEFEYTQEALAKGVSKSRSHVANMMRLLDLPDVVKQLLDAGELSAGHARALLGAVDPTAHAKHVIAKGLNVRQTERLVKHDAKRKPASVAPPTKDADTIILEKDLTDLLGLKITINHRTNHGHVIVHYKSLDQLDNFLRRLRGGASATSNETAEAQEQPSASIKPTGPE